MDEPLLRMLQSIKRIEDDPSMRFQTETIDLATFIPKCERVVFVDQRFDLSQHSMVAKGVALLPPGIISPGIRSRRRHFIANELTWASDFAFCAYFQGKVSSGWTIILKDGLFINPFDAFGSIDDLVDETDSLPPLTMEIVGLQDVRILIDHDLENFLFLEHVNLSMRNVRIYDYRPNPSIRHPIIAVKTDCHLEGVMIHAPKVPITLCGEPGPRMFMKGCSVSIWAMLVTSGNLRAENCLIIDRRKSEVTKGGSFFADHVCFRGYGIQGSINSKCVLQGCEFNAVGDSENEPALDISTSSEVDCSGSTFSGYKCPVKLTGSGTSVVLRHCDFFGGFAPASVWQNANLLLADSSIQCDFLLSVFFNVKGKVELLRNRLDPSTQRVICKNSVSKNPIVDTSNVTYRCVDIPVSSAFTDQQLSKTTKLMEEMESRECTLTSETTSLVLQHSYKFCRKCGLGVEKPEPSVKFLYCGGCRAICYCSKKCQKADWEDHRLICQKITEGQSKSKKKGEKSGPKAKK